MNHFNEILDQMKMHGMATPSGKVMISIPNAKQVVHNALNYFISIEGKKAIWLPAYDRVAEWFTDNKGRGLFLYGECGQGKSILGRYVIPAILLKYCNKVVKVYDTNELNSQLDQILQKHIISIDDVGTEDISVKFGEKRQAFSELIDSVEKQGKLIIITSNLTVEELTQKYGSRVVDRIISTTTRVLFDGKSLRI